MSCDGHSGFNRHRAAEAWATEEVTESITFSSWRLQLKDSEPPTGSGHRLESPDLNAPFLSNTIEKRNHIHQHQLADENLADDESKEILCGHPPDWNQTTTPLESSMDDNTSRPALENNRRNRELETETLQVAGPPYESLCCQMVRLVPSNLLQY
ncbi:hypothetical protein PCANC_20692 [Puccinia coronata f. sp. avenae]|uniref:Uncharacterized protein n=1 Tax=Puccinia coronata f. sp. avenae TaxID=200324 RepID=A0A2N5TZS7_9BASI|nr:hypothetical protein PCANC_20692 [Puccinia coronata f. sp. avenae]